MALKKTLGFNMKPPQSGKKKKADKPWAGRFSEAVDPLVEVFTASLPFDYRLLPYDLIGSMAHLKMLTRQGPIMMIFSGLLFRFCMG